MSATVAYIVVLGSLVFMVVATAYARKYPNRSKEYPDRIRMPKVVPILSWAFISFGLVLGVMAWSAPDGPLDARIASVAAVLGGWIFLRMYRNFYLAPRQHEVAFRTALGREHVFPYSDIADCQLVTRKNNQYLRVKSIHGVRLNVNTSIYDMGPLLRANEYHETTGRWPGRGETLPEDQPRRYRK